MSVSASTLCNKGLVDEVGCRYKSPSPAPRAVGGRMKRCVALWVVCAVWSLAASASAHSARFQDSIATDSTGRVRLNFNADWRFKLGKSDGAQQPNFDDSAW